MKSLKKIGLAVISAAILLGFASCKKSTEEPPHEHTFATEWTSDATSHWHAATCEHTSELKDKAEHTFGEFTVENGMKTKKCSVCGYAFLAGPVLKAGSSDNYGGEFRKALKDNLGVKADYSDANVTKVVFGLLSDDAIKAKVSTLTKKTDIGAVDGTCYAYAEPDGENLIIYIVPADEKATGFVFNEDSSSMFYSFKKCTEIAGLNLADTSNVTSINSMFYNCSGLTALDVSNFNTSKVTDMSGMFAACSALTALNVSNFNTSNATKMNGMFWKCSALTSLDLSGFDTSKVTDMQQMFEGCSSLTALDLSNFNTSNVTIMWDMFSYCSGLTALDVSKFDTSKVTSMNYMFRDCSGLTALDVSKFDTSNVTSMNYMFSGCSELTALDLSNFDTSKVTDMSSMFYDCEKLATIYVEYKDSFVPDAVKSTTAVNENSDDYMFKDCKVQDFTNIADKQ